jgi:FtsH-binding integral membrane protein
MVQRIQSIWLLLAAILAFVFTQVPIFISTIAGNVAKRFFPTESLLLFALSVAIGLLAVACIFLYKNRPLQLKLSIIGILACVILIALEVWQISRFEADNSILKGSYYWGSLIPIGAMVCFILAASAIRKDEKLVKSLDRLR